MWRALIALAVLAFIAIGLLGTGSYWESYYQHRGFVPPQRVANGAVGRRETVEFYSQALGRRADYLVYLPAGYSPTTRYPVLYLLHGDPGRPQLFFDVGNVGVRLDNLTAQRQVPPMIVVVPDGRIGGSQFSDTEWADTRAGRFESYVLEAMRDADQRFATIPDRRARVLAGYSSGAYGALNIALHHLDAFASVQLWSGYYEQPNPAGPFAGASRATLAYNSPDAYVPKIPRRLALLPLSVFIYGGRADPASVLIAPMVKELRVHHASAGYAIYKGGHDWQLWNAHFNHMLILAGRSVGGPLTFVMRLAEQLHAFPGPAPPRRVIAQPVARTVVAHRVNRGHGPGGTGTGELLAGLVLALVSAAAINIGFLLQHRGLRSARSLPGGRSQLVRAMFRNRSWLGGQVLGWAGFGAQILAVTIAPLSLVQSFAAGGLALSVPLAARMFGHRIARRQKVAVLLVALGLAVLPIGLSAHGDHLAGGRLTITTCLVLAAAAGVAAVPRAVMRAIASGLFYGVADAAIKAISVRWGAEGADALLSGWALLAVGSTFAGFVSFQAALGAGSAVASISLMNCLAALVALVGGLVAFGESLGTGAAPSVVHFLAIGLVLACVPVLAAAQAELTDTPPREQTPDRKQRRLQPRTKAWTAREQRVAEAHVARS
jgi:enterochelin esterase-like enzyme